MTAFVETVWREAAGELPPVGVVVVVRTAEGRYHEAAWCGDGVGYWHSRDWQGFAARRYVSHWAQAPTKGAERGTGD